VVSQAVNEHIEKNYQRWSDYAEYHASLARIPDEAGDILDEVLLNLLQKDDKKLTSLLSRKKQGYTELDFFVLKMIKLNTHSETSPYRHKTKNVPLNQNISPGDLNPEDLQQEDDIDQEIKILQRTRQAREILASLNLPDREKEIFSWKFFADNPLSKWPGPEGYTTVCWIFNKVKRKMMWRIKNPHSSRRKWTGPEIEYLKAEYPYMETIKIAGYLGRNYKSVERMAQKLRLMKSHSTLSRINRRNRKKQPLQASPIQRSPIK